MVEEMEINGKLETFVKIYFVESQDLSISAICGKQSYLPCNQGIQMLDLDNDLPSSPEPSLDQLQLLLKRRLKK